MMPYLGVPFTPEGSPEGLLEILRLVRELAPRQLMQGHTTLTENFTIEALAGLEPALTELRGSRWRGSARTCCCRTSWTVVFCPPCCRITPPRSCRTWSAGMVSSPGSITSAPDTGSQTDRALTRGLEERAAALDLLAGEKADAFVTAAATLAGQGDLALALELLTPGLVRYPDSSDLATLRREVLVRLMEERQLFGSIRIPRVRRAGGR